MNDTAGDSSAITKMNEFGTSAYARHNPQMVLDELADGNKPAFVKTMSCPQLTEPCGKRKKCKGSDNDEEDDEPNETDVFLTPGAKPEASLLNHSVKNAKESFNHAMHEVNKVAHKVDKFAHKVWDGRWRVVSFFQLQDWQKDNEFLHHWHRPAMPSFRACFGSIFRIHTETGNIWTHLLGVILFITICINFLCLPTTRFISAWQEKIVFFLFFLGAVLCLCFSTLFHTMGCHSERVFRIFGKLDYSGIALMIMGSFVPWIYYSFYCDSEPKVIYMSVICVLGVLCIVISQWDKFGTAKYRSTRAIIFAALGLSGIVPAIHMTFKLGFLRSVTVGQLGWLYLMACLYLTGAFLYACRIPERYFPGKCDLMFQSHQIFHILVVAAAIVHFHGISKLQESRFHMGEQCITGDPENF